MNFEAQFCGEKVPELKNYFWDAYLKAHRQPVCFATVCFCYESSHCSVLQSDSPILENGEVFIYENCARNASWLKVGL